ncbi:ectonucleotide pyrophosphatase/phosphodiesterase [Sandarakinorhabdus sp. DWP1-3-1]|uniref:alkaline phosphatase family protein n=1 Tax=Sandarakinorhabdus sp. DWP1-3-1 TaxID=2804627 RepID=UPI003CF6C610
MRHPILLLLLMLAACAGPRVATAPGAGSRPPVILVSIDGFRPDYLTRGVTPNLNALAAAGTRATAMRPSFPSLTFPNHYTIVTGLRPDHHGVVGNNMEDAAIPGVRFGMGNRDAVGDRRWWDQGEPIWVTAERAGIKTATMFWPGSEAPVQGVRPTRWLPFDGAMPGDRRVDTLLGWLDGPDRPGLATLYFDTVDHDGHEFGPDAPQTTAAVAAVDVQIGRLVAGLQARGIAANIVVVSDHGMAAVPADHIIRIDEIAPAGSFRLVGSGAVAGIESQPGQEAALAAALLQPRPHLQCWRKGQMPARYGYGRNARVPALVCLADVGWYMLAAPPRADMTLGGAHGFDPAAPEMAASFVAAGPAFRAGTVLPPFDNVDVHPLLLRLLGLPPRASDGTIAPLRKALR